MDVRSRRRPERAWLAGILLAGMTALPAAQGSTIAGRISGAPIPPAGTGQAFVRAVSLQTGEVVRADDVDAAGRYRLTVPKGAFAVFPTVIRPGKLFAPKPTKVRLRRGQRKSVRLPARATATVARPIVALPDDSFKGGTGEYSVLNRGLKDMLITDLTHASVRSCDITVVERSRTFMTMRGVELALVRGGLVDPATAIRPGLLINPTRGIRGTIGVNGDRMVITAEIYRWSSKKTIHRTSVEGAPTEFFDRLQPALATKLAQLLCDRPPPVSGTFSGSVDYARQVPVGQLIGSLDWSGSLELEPQDTPGIPAGVPGLPPGFGGPSVSYGVRSGTLTARVNVRSVVPGCTNSGQATFDIVAITAGANVPVLTITEGDPDTYRLTLDGGSAIIPTVLSACPPGQEASNGMTATWPIRGYGLLPFSQTPGIMTEGLFAGTATGTTPGLDDGYQWTWSLRG